MPADLDEAVDALRSGRVARAHVLTRRAARPAWIDGLPEEDVDNLRQTSLGALFWAFEGALLGEWLIPLDPAKARAFLESAQDDRGPAHLALAFLNPDAARKQKRENILTPYAAAAALQWDAREAAARIGEHNVLHRQDRVDKSGSYVAGQAFDLWNAPYARFATPEELALFLELMGKGRRRAAWRRLYLRLRAQDAPCPEPPPLPAEHPDPARGVDDAVLAAADTDQLLEILAQGDPAWLHERWASIRDRLGEHERIPGARRIFERLLEVGVFDPGLLELTRESWSAWAEAFRALARFRPEQAREEAAKAPVSHRSATLQRVLEGEADALTFDIRLAALRRVAGDEAATRAALWLLLGEPPRWHDEGRLMQILVALGETPVERPFWRLLFEDLRGVLRPDLRQAILRRGGGC